MYKYRKKNIKSKTRDMLQSSMLKFSPFDYTDTNYLSHLAEQLNPERTGQTTVGTAPTQSTLSHQRTP